MENIDDVKVCLVGLKLPGQEEELRNAVNAIFFLNLPLTPEGAEKAARLVGKCFPRSSADLMQIAYRAQQIVARTRAAIAAHPEYVSATA